MADGATSRGSLTGATATRGFAAAAIAAVAAAGGNDRAQQDYPSPNPELHARHGPTLRYVVRKCSPLLERELRSTNR